MAVSSANFKKTRGAAGSGVGYGAAAKPQRWVLVPPYAVDYWEGPLCLHEARSFAGIRMCLIAWVFITVCKMLLSCL